jgi:hypothetical protein
MPAHTYIHSYTHTAGRKAKLIRDTIIANASHLNYTAPDMSGRNIRKEAGPVGYYYIMLNGIQQQES